MVKFSLKLFILKKTEMGDIMKPIIGVIPLYDDERESIWMLPGYLKLIEENGGVPLILPLTTRKETLTPFLTDCDGFLFTGGQDIDPSLYNEEKREECGNQCQARDEMESYLMREVIARDKPLLAICRGVQLLNVLYGGTLYQDLSSEYATAIVHQMTPPYDKIQHEVDLIENSLLHRILGQAKLGVNSYHHQAIKNLGEGLESTAVSTDGLVEGITLPTAKFVLGVQWHPEFFKAATLENQAIIRAFYSACLDNT